MTNATMTDDETETLALGIVIAQGSLQSSMRPVLAFTEGDGRVSIADVGSPVWDRAVDDQDNWEKEVHKAEYICDTSDSVEDALAKVDDYGFHHVYAVSGADAHEEFGKIAELRADDN